MYEYPNNYEEAKILIRKAVDDDFVQKSKKKAFLIPAFLYTVATAASIAAGIHFDSAFIGAFLAPDLWMLLSPSLIPYHIYKDSIKNIKNGKYFEKLSEEEVIKKAREYAEQYNAYERKKMGNTDVAKDEDSEGFTL